MAAIVGLNLLLLEMGSSFVLYRYYAHKRQEVHTDQLMGLATLEVLKIVARRGGIELWQEPAQLASTPSPFYVSDPDLGYTARPGAYQIEMTRGERRYRFSVTLEAQGNRASAYQPSTAGRKLYVLGDSTTWGWANNDEHVYSWLLQQRFPQLHVLNFSHNGYSDIQALIQLRRLAPAIGRDDFVLVIYGDYFNRRHVAAPSYIRSAFQGVRSIVDQGLTHPRAVLDDGRLQIRQVNVLCELNDGWCERDDPPKAHMYEVTKAIFAEIVDLVAGKVVVGHCQGPDADPVLDFLRRRNVDVVDIRPSEVSHEMDDLEPFDGHPGPLAHYHYFAKLAEYFEQHVQPGAAAIPRAAAEG